MKHVNRWILLAFILPSFIVYFMFVIYPTLMGFVLGFTDWNGYSDTYKFVGLKNFIRLSKDPLIKIALKNTTIFTVLSVVFQNIFAILLAVLLDRKGWLSGIFKSVFFFPVLMSNVVVSYIWSTIFNPVMGVYKPFMEALGLTAAANIDVLGNGFYALYAVIFVKVWQWTGYLMVIYIAGLQTIPEELNEAAAIDGAGAFKKFFKVTLPLLMPSVTINVVVCTIGSLKQFDHIHLMTGGGPGNATQVFGTAIYSVAFGGFRYGYGVATSMILFLLVGIISLVQVKILSKREVGY